MSRKPNYRRISRGDLDFPRTAIIAYVEDNAMTIITTTSKDEAPDGHSDGGFILIASYF